MHADVRRFGRGVGKRNGAVEGDAGFVVAADPIELGTTVYGKSTSQPPFSALNAASTALPTDPCELRYPAVRSWL